MSLKHINAFQVAFAFCCLCLAIPIWMVDYLPMVDIPQHAAQISIWKHWQDPAFGYQNIYETNWFTPYLFGYSLTYALAWVFSIHISLKLLVTLAIIGIPIAALWLLKEFEASPWWVFAVFPTVYSFSFSWGFLNFVVGTPIAIAFLALMVRFQKEPNLRRSIWLALALTTLFIVHLILLGYCGLIAGCIAIHYSKDLKDLAKRLLPLLAPLPLIVGWILNVRATHESAQHLLYWKHSWPRFFSLLPESVGELSTTRGFVLGLIVFALPFVFGARFSRNWTRWLPFLMTAFLFVAFPSELMGTSFVHGRFGVFLVPTWMFALEFGPMRIGPWLRNLLGPGFVALWIAMIAFRFSGFHDETRGFSEIAKQIPQHARVLSLPVARNSEYVRAPVFLHFPVWNQVERGGTVDFSFAQYFPQVFRYTKLRDERVTIGFEWYPLSFDWQRHKGSVYDYFIARAPKDVGHFVFRTTTEPIDFVANSGMWWLYKRANSEIK